MSHVPGPNPALEALGREFGDRLSLHPAIRAAHGKGEGLSAGHPPEAVVFAQTSEDVAAALRICGIYRMPVIPYGAGTSLEGQLEAVEGGISLDLSGMSQILSVEPSDLDCRVEAGVTREQLNLHLRDMGLFFPLDPGANATLGGMAATRASGTNAVRYGTMREVVLGLTAVMPDGIIIQTGGRARKSATGYDLTRLLIGSEGTLGVITEVQLRLFGIPERIAGGVVQFDSVAQAVDAVIATLQMGVPVARIELLDELQMQACIAYSRLAELTAAPTLFVEFHGSPESVTDQVTQCEAIFADHGGAGWRWAVREEDRNRLWKARHDAYHAARALRPGFEAIATDACVPISQLAECIAETRAEVASSGLTCPLVGHVGDGNFHLLILYDPREVTQRHRALALANSVGRRAIQLGGTCSGEHGIGLHKRALAAQEAGASAAVMRTIKAALDPLNIMNPGKTLPDPDTPFGISP